MLFYAPPTLKSWLRHCLWLVLFVGWREFELVDEVSMGFLVARLVPQDAIDPFGQSSCRGFAAVASSGCFILLCHFDKRLVGKIHPTIQSQIEHFLTICSRRALDHRKSEVVFTLKLYISNLCRDKLLQRFMKTPELYFHYIVENLCTIY